MTVSEMSDHIVYLSMQLRKSGEAMSYWADRANERWSRIEELEAKIATCNCGSAGRLSPGTPDERD